MVWGTNVVILESFGLMDLEFFKRQLEGFSLPKYTTRDVIAVNDWYREQRYRPWSYEHEDGFIVAAHFPALRGLVGQKYIAFLSVLLWLDKRISYWENSAEEAVETIVGLYKDLPWRDAYIVIHEVGEMGSIWNYDRDKYLQWFTNAHALLTRTDVETTLKGLALIKSGVPHEFIVQAFSEDIDIELLRDILGE